jgi:ribose 5-phosphate isomerase RpiB
MIEQLNDSEVEANILGMLFVSREIAKKIVNICIEDDFFDDSHRRIFVAAKDLIGQGQYFDLTLLCKHLDIEDHYRVAEVHFYGITDAMFEEYFKCLREISKKRRLIEAKGNSDSINAILKEEDILYSDNVGIIDREKVKNYLNNKNENIYSTGWVNFTQHYKISKGQLTIVSGIPSHGKSTFLDNLAINMVTNHKWKVMFFSPENLPVEKHVFKLLRMLSFDDQDRSLDWIEKSFRFIAPHPDKRNLQNILYSVKDVDLFILDPWNELESARPKNLSETEYVGECLKFIKAHAVMNDMHIIIAAHPTKLVKNDNGEYPVPKPYDIMGSSHWLNKADACFAVYRPESNSILGNRTEVYIQKIRFQPENGQLGQVNFRYKDFRFEEL